MKSTECTTTGVKRDSKHAGQPNLQSSVADGMQESVSAPPQHAASPVTGAPALGAASDNCPCGIPRTCCTADHTASNYLQQLSERAKGTPIDVDEIGQPHLKEEL